MTRCCWRCSSLSTYRSSSFKWRLDSSSTTAPVGDVEGMVLWVWGGRGAGVGGVVVVTKSSRVQAASSAERSNEAAFLPLPDLTLATAAYP